MKQIAHFSKALHTNTHLSQTCIAICLGLVTLGAIWQTNAAFAGAVSTTSQSNNANSTNASTDPNQPSLFPVTGTNTNSSNATGAGSAATCTPSTGDPACAGAGNPINVMTGNKYQREEDLPALPGLMGIEIVRHYNSLHMGLGQIGYGWRLGYEINLTANQTSIHISKADGSQTIFNRSVFNPSDCACQDPAQGHVMIYHTPQGDEYTWFKLDGQQLHFNHQGKLESITAPTGESVHLTRGLRGELLKVTDPQGRSLIMHYADKKSVGFKGIIAIDTPVGRFSYQHNNDLKNAGISNLIQVTYPSDTTFNDNSAEDQQAAHTQTRTRSHAGLTKTYHYGETAYVDAHMLPANSGRPQILHAAHLLTGTSLTWSETQTDKPQLKTVRQRTWMYDAYGRGILSVHGLPKQNSTNDKVLANIGQQQINIRYHVAPIKSDSHKKSKRSKPSHATQLYPRITHNGQIGQTIITNSQGQTTTYNYTLIAGEYRLLQVIGAGCAECIEPNVVYGYDKLGRQTEVTKVSLTGKTDSKSLSDKKAQQVYQAISATHTDYDQAGRVIQISRIGYSNGKAQPAQLQVRYSYPNTPVFPQPTTAKRVVLEPIQVFSQPSLIAKPSVVAGKEHQWRIRYNQYGQPLEVVETGYRPALPTDKTYQPIAISRITTYVYSQINGRSLLTQVDGALPNAYHVVKGQRRNNPANSDITQYEYDKLGQYLTTITAPNNVVTRFEYDTTGIAEAGSAATGGTGRMVQSTLNDGARVIQTNTTYSQQVNSLNQPTHITRTAWLLNKNGSATISNVDKRSKQITTILEANYDAQGRRTMHMGADGDRQTMQYNEAGFAAQLINGQGDSLNWAYDAQGNPLAQASIDAQGKVMDGRLWLRDETGKLKAMLTPNGVASVSFDLPALTNATHNTTNSKEIEGAFAQISNIRKMRGADQLRDDNPSSRVTLRDDFGRAIYERHPEDGAILTTFKPVNDSQLGSGEKQTQTHISLDGKSKQIEELHFSFAGQLFSRQRTANDEAPCVEKLSYEGKVLKSLKGCESEQTFVRNAFGQIITQTQTVYSVKHNMAGTHFTQHFAYDNAGKLIRRTTPAGQVLTYGYGEQQQNQTPSIQLQRSWLSSVAKLTSQGVATNIANTLPESWTQTTLITQVQKQPFNETIAALQSVQHGNGIQTTWQPNKAAINNAVPLWVKVSAALNAQSRAGLQITKTKMVESNQAIKIDPFGRLTQYKPSVGDNAGKPLNLKWNTANQLIAVLDANTQKPIARYGYDSTGNRVSKTIYSSTNLPQTTYYAYDNAHKVIAESKGGIDITRQYLYLDHRLHSMIEGNNTYAVSTDWRGMPQQVTDADKKTVWQQQFDAWGNFIPKKILKTPQRITDVNIRLAGQYYDAETGLHCNIHRYFNPQTGRYISPDPLGTPDGYDRYAYLNGNPNAGIDPLGLFEVPFFAFSGLDVLPISDEGHGDIVRLAFAQFNREKGLRFSQTIIDQVIINNYHSDAASNLLGGTGGQFNSANHFDNPNDGPLYDLDGNKTASYTNGKGDNWIQLSLNQIKKNRGSYTHLETKGIYQDISTIIGRFGQNAHALADFYAHTNWVDAENRGGEVCQKLKLRLTTTMEKGYVPIGLNQSEIWDEKVTANIYSGTVDINPLNPNSILGCYTDIGCTADKTTHGYWNKDHKGLTPDEVAFTEPEINDFNSKNMYFWEVLEYNPKSPPRDDKNKLLEFGEQWYGEAGVAQSALKAGDRIYVRREIANHHDLAYYLAVEHTKKEIERLYSAAAGVSVGNHTLGEVFKMDKMQLGQASISYTVLPSKQ